MGGSTRTLANQSKESTWGLTIAGRLSRGSSIGRMPTSTALIRKSRTKGWITWLPSNEQGLSRGLSTNVANRARRHLAGLGGDVWGFDCNKGFALVVDQWPSRAVAQCRRSTSGAFLETKKSAQDIRLRHSAAPKKLLWVHKRRRSLTAQIEQRTHHRAHRLASVPCPSTTKVNFTQQVSCPKMLCFKSRTRALCVLENALCP